MSRSYKHHFVAKPRNSQYHKRLFNKLFRRTMISPSNRKLYRKIGDPYSICDYRFRTPLNIYIKRSLRIHNETDYELIQEWLKWYVRK